MRLTSVANVFRFTVDELPFAVDELPFAAVELFFAPDDLFFSKPPGKRESYDIVFRIAMQKCRKAKFRMLSEDVVFAANMSLA